MAESATVSRRDDVGRDASGDTHADGDDAVLQRLDGVDHPPGHRCRDPDVGAEQQRPELVAAQPGDQVTVADQPGEH